MGEGHVAGRLERSHGLRDAFVDAGDCRRRRAHPPNPAKGARLAPIDTPPFIPLDVDQVRGIARAAPDHIRAAVVLAAGTGLRQGELFGLTADRVDFMRLELRVDRQLWTPANGRPFLRPPKSRNSYRTVALSALVVETLAAHLSTFGSGEDQLTLHTAGRAIARSLAAHYMRASAKRAEVRARWHDLRHHHASVLLAEGVNPSKVAARLGHDLTTLLATYAHIMPRDDDKGRSIVDATPRGSAEDGLSRGELRR